MSKSNNMNNKLYWCEEAGAVFWLENGEVMVVPVNQDGTVNLRDGGPVEFWGDCPVTEEQVRAELA